MIGPLTVPRSVLDEAIGLDRPGAAEIRNALRSGLVSVAEAVTRDDLPHLGSGEADAIALARANGCPVLLDERPARAVAKRVGVAVTGTLGVLVRLKRSGQLERLAPVLQRLDEIGFHMDEDLRAHALRLAGEEDDDQSARDRP